MSRHRRRHDIKPPSGAVDLAGWTIVPPRAICAVPFCGLPVPDSHPDDEGLCRVCWAKARGHERDRYSAAWDVATARDKGEKIDSDVEYSFAYENVNAAWDTLKAHALKVCGRAT